MAEFEQIMVEQIGDVVRITLNRPERLNAWTPKMLGEMTQVITGRPTTTRRSAPSW